MTNTIDITAARAAWEALEAACAGLLASQCKSHRPYLGCPMDCNDVANALDPELANARPFIEAALDEVAKLRSELAEAHEALTAARANEERLRGEMRSFASFCRNSGWFNLADEVERKASDRG